MDRDDLKRYSVTEVVLLAIFALGLGLSLIVVRVRGHVEPGEPVALPGSGLAAAIPKGDKWQSAGGWHYETDNAYVLLGQMHVAGRPEMRVRWRYALCEQTGDPEQVLQTLADTAGGKLVPLGMAEGPVPLVFGRIYVPAQGGQDFLMGVASLDFGRRLELQISYRSDGWFAENVFRTLAANIRYERPTALQAGAERVHAFFEDIETTAGGLFIPNAARQLHYLVKDVADRPLGFVEQRFFAHNDPLGKGYYRITMRQLEQGGLYSESDLWLDAEEDAFTWTTRSWLSRSRQPRVVEVRADAQRRIVLTSKTEPEGSFRRTEMMLPEPLLPVFAAGLADAGDQIFVVDVLTGSGNVVPTQLAVIDANQSHVRASDPVWVVRADYLHTQGAFDELVFDRQGQCLGRFEQQPQRPVRLWEQADTEALRRIFGERYEGSSQGDFQEARS